MASTSSTTSENLNVDLELDFESEETEIGKVCFCGNELLDDLVNCAGMSCETEWFHVGCSGLTDTDAHTEEWFCENCQEQMYADEHDACEDQTPGHSASRKDDRKQKTTQGNKTKETAPKCPQVYTVQNALDMSVVFILQCLNSFFTDSLYCMDSGLSVELQTLAKQLLENGSVPLKEFSKFIVQQLWDVIYPDNKRPITSSDRGRMWNRFHNLRLDPQVLKVWKELLSRINLLTIALSSAQLFMLQHILEFLMKLIIAEQQKYDMPMKDDIDTVFPISQHEEQIIRYVAGYIPFALKRRLLRQKNLDNSVLDFVKSLSVESASAEGTSFYNYTKQWINKQNRGGLFVVNNLTYLFFKTLEYHTKKVLNVKRLMVLKDVNIKSELLNVLNTHNQVQKRWDELVTTELDVKVKQDLLKLFVGYWVKLRVNAFVRMYMEVRKRNNKKAGKKGEKALRKTLANQDK